MKYSYEEAIASLKQYPYFLAPAVSALAEASADERKELARRIAAAVCSEADLRNILGMDSEEFANFYPDQRPAELSTNDTIDSFLEKFATPEKSATPEVERIVSAPAIDYAAMMLDDEEIQGDEESDDATSDAISAFLQAVPPKTSRRKQQKPEPEPASAPQQSEQPELSEALVKIMVKNGNYRKALEIITELNLKNPKKSIYFADQMRFLKKLIQNQERSSAGKA